MIKHVQDEYLDNREEGTEAYIKFHNARLNLFSSIKLGPTKLNWWGKGDEKFTQFYPGNLKGRDYLEHLCTDVKKYQNGSYRNFVLLLQWIHLQAVNVLTFIPSGSTETAKTD